MPLGLEADVDCCVSHSELTPGHGVVLFTDGLLEAREPSDGNAKRGQFGSERVAGLLAQLRGADVSRVVRELRSAAEGFAGGALTDDLCIVAVQAKTA